MPAQAQAPAARIHFLRVGIATQRPVTTTPASRPMLAVISTGRRWAISARSLHESTTTDLEHERSGQSYRLSITTSSFPFEGDEEGDMVATEAEGAKKKNSPPYEAEGKGRKAEERKGKELLRTLSTSLVWATRTRVRRLPRQVLFFPIVSSLDHSEQLTFVHLFTAPVISHQPRCDQNLASLRAFDIAFPTGVRGPCHSFSSLYQKLNTLQSFCLFSIDARQLSNQNCKCAFPTKSPRKLAALERAALLVSASKTARMSVAIS